MRPSPSWACSPVSAPAASPPRLGPSRPGRGALAQPRGARPSRITKAPKAVRLGLAVMGLLRKEQFSRQDRSMGPRASIPGEVRPGAGSSAIFGGFENVFPHDGPGRVAVRRAAGAGGSQFTKESILRDYRIAYQSRQASLIGRREVLTGKAKFGIFGDGKEVAQVALARAFRQGDFRSGYYRDQTLMMALGLLTAGAVLRPALRGRRRGARALLGGPVDERPLRDLHARGGRQLQGSGGPGQLVGRRLADRLADAAPGGARLRLEALPRAAGAPEIMATVLAQRRRGGLRHDRQRELRRGDVLGGGQRRGRPAVADAALDLGRRLRHLGAERVPDHQGGPLGGALRLPPRARRPARGTTSTRSRAGTTRRCARPISRPSRSCGGSTCRRSST